MSILTHSEYRLYPIRRETDDEDVTLFLHIYENALSCTLIWLIAGRN